MRTLTRIDAFENQHLNLSRRLSAEVGSEFLINEDMTDDEPKQDQTIKIPSENRSQYEKLSSTQEDFSSDDELGPKESRKKLQKHHHVHKPKPTAIIKNIKPQNALRASKTIVLAKKNKLQGSLMKNKYVKKLDAETNQNETSNIPEQRQQEAQPASDEDSIGSASDLRDVDEMSDGEPVSESEIESLDRPSVYTCGSSVYHAECESMTASNNFETRRRKRAVRETTIKSEEEDEIQHKDKPLLEEFESDTSPQFWESAWENEGKDVFAMAPFQKMDATTRTKTKPSAEDLVTFSPEKLKLDLLTFSESDSQHEDRRETRSHKSPNLIILSESDSDLKKPQEADETQTLLSNESQEVNTHLIKDVTVTERLHMVREKLKPLEKLEESEPFTPVKNNVKVAENPTFYKENSNSKSKSFNDMVGANFPKNLQGFSPKMFPQEKVPEYAEKKDIFGFTPFNVLTSNRNPFEGDEFKPTIQEDSQSKYFDVEQDHRQFNAPVGTNPRSPSPVFDNRKVTAVTGTTSPLSNAYGDSGFVRSGAIPEKESKVHFSLSDKILNFKSEKKIFYDSLKHEDKLKKKFEEKSSKGKNCDKGGEKHSKKHSKNDRKVERGFSNMSFEDCLSGEDSNHVEDRCTIEARMGRMNSFQRQSNPFT
ncbi:hypothetical protein RUM44_004345 [Polyplax serrata]|uniref:Uncharacterized protein n=1 Tax=Polyplax serrata TaxID=468196 RepID=A0ABR1B476_POLSC